jgi:NADH:ubiquinone oxidoreductase subunit K
MMPIIIFMAVSGILFAVGLLIFQPRRSFGASVLAVGLVWIGAILNLVVLSREGIGGFSGQGVAILLTILAGFEILIVWAIGRPRKERISDEPNVCEPCCSEE